MMIDLIVYIDSCKEREPLRFRRGWNHLCAVVLCGLELNSLRRESSYIRNSGDETR